MGARLTVSSVGPTHLFRCVLSLVTEKASVSLLEVAEHIIQFLSPHISPLASMRCPRLYSRRSQRAEAK